MRLNKDFTDPELVLSLEQLPEYRLRAMVKREKEERPEMLKALDELHAAAAKSGLSQKELARLTDIPEDEWDNLGIR